MFLRFRPIKSRLYVSLVSSVREAFTVRLEHHGALGSVALERPGKLESSFVWQRLHDTVTRLGLGRHTARALAEALENRIPRPIEAAGLLPEPFATTAKAAPAAPVAAPRAALATTVPVSEIEAKWKPLIKGLKEQGRKNPVTMSPPIVASLTRDLERSLTGWKERKPTALATTGRKDQPVIRLSEVEAKVAPLLKGLVAEGKKSTATMSPGTVAQLAALLEDLPNEWAGKPTRFERRETRSLRAKAGAAKKRAREEAERKALRRRPD